MVGVNPSPTVLSRFSSPCIAPWQLYCTSFLGHDALHSGYFPSVFVEESRGAQPHAVFYSYFRQVQEKVQRQQEDLHCLLPVVERCEQNSSLTDPPGHSENTNLRVCVLFRSCFSINRRHSGYCPHTPAAQKLCCDLASKLHPSFPFVPLI